jgi:hypothetical protein
VCTAHALKAGRIDVPANASAALGGVNLRANRPASAGSAARYGR